MITTAQEAIKSSENHSKIKAEAEGRNFCTRIDAETAMLLDEIRSKYSKETNASILAKAIQILHDRTCRTLVRTVQAA